MPNATSIITCKYNSITNNITRREIGLGKWDFINIARIEDIFRTAMSYMQEQFISQFTSQNYTHLKQSPLLCSYSYNAFFL